MFGLIAAAMLLAPPQATCEFAAVKQQIDTGLDYDAEKVAIFWREVSTGSASIAVLESLISPGRRRSTSAGSKRPNI